jgi:hypothetical protein
LFEFPAGPSQTYTVTITYTDTERGPAMEDTLALFRWVRLLLQSPTKPCVRWRTGVGYDATYLLSAADRSRGLRANLGQQWVLA